jgi:uncharacterized protein with gpF-like domain
MTDEEIQREFDRKVKEIIEKIFRQERETLETARQLLEQTRSDIVARISEGGRTEFDAFWLRQVRVAIEARIERLNQDLQVRLNADTNKMFDLGNELVNEPVRAVLGVNPILGVSREVAQVAASFSASLIKDLTSSAQSAIDGVLRRAALGGLKVQEAIAQIGTSLDTSKTFSSIAARAETIFRTEVLRIQSIATQARMQSNAEAMRRAGWALKKKWLATIDLRVRASHLAANGQIREQDEPFLVAGEELMYPRDPSGSAGETINCRCVSSPVVERIYKIDRETKFKR